MAFNYALRPITHQTITMDSSSPASVHSSAFGSQVEYVRVCAESDFHIAFGSSPTASVSTMFIPADQPEIFKVEPGTKIAALGSASARISIDELSA